MTIRRATRTDIAAIVRIEKASFGNQAWPRAEFLNYLAEPDRCDFLVAVSGRAVSGYIIGYRTPTRAEVDSLAVSPSHRRHGIAAALMNRLKSILRRRGYKALGLTVRLNNTAAIAMYRKHGFVRVRRINRCYEDGAPAWRMRTSLTVRPSPGL